MPKRSGTRITKSRVDALGPGQTLWDSDLAGFGVRAQARSKTFVLKTMARGKQVWIKIGRYGPLTVEQARHQAIGYLSDFQRGTDPRTRPAKKGIQVRELCRRYLEQHARPNKKPSSARMDEKNVHNHVLPLLGHLELAAVTPADIEAFKVAVRNGKTAVPDRAAQQKRQGGGAVVTGGPGVANRCLALLSKMFNLAERWQLRPQGTNPVQRLERYRENPRERFLSDEEFRRLGDALAETEKEAESVYAVAAIRLLLFTGARLSEILTLRWDQVDFDRNWLQLDDSKTGPKRIMLAGPAREVLQRLPKTSGNPYVIVGRRQGEHLKNLQKPWGRMRRRAGLEGVRLHDLRHSFASAAAAEGLPLFTIGTLLGHAKPVTTARYAHLADATVRSAGTVVANAIRQKLNGR